MNSNKHTLALESFSSLVVTAIDDVLSFDDSLVSLSVGDKVLNISGDGLSIKNLSLENGSLTVNGNISAMVYFENTPRRKRRIFGNK